MKLVSCRKNGDLEMSSTLIVLSSGVSIATASGPALSVLYSSAPFTNVEMM